MRRRRHSRDFSINDPSDGLEINRLNDGKYISRATSSISMFDADNIAIELIETINGHTFHIVSVMAKAKKANNYKTGRINRYKDRIKGR